MNIKVHFKSNEEKKAFMCGLAFYLGYLKASNKELAFDANTNNPYWITTENGHHYLIDDDGIIQSGRFKNQSIGGVKEAWRKKSTQYNPSKIGKRNPYYAVIKPNTKLPDVRTYLDKANGNYKRAIKNYYDENLKNKQIQIEVPYGSRNEKVYAYFASGDFRDEFTGKHHFHYDLILNCLPHVVDVLTNGQIANVSYKEHSHNLIRFFTFVKKVNVNGNDRLIAIDVGESKFGFFINYNLTTEGVKGWETKQKYFDKGLTY